MMHTYASDSLNCALTLVAASTTLTSICNISITMNAPSKIAHESYIFNSSDIVLRNSSCFLFLAIIFP